MSIAEIDTCCRRAVVFTPMETDRSTLVEAAVLADRRGYEAVIIPEGWSLDATIVAAEIAMRTERIRIVTGVLSVWGRTAGTLAMTAASLDDLSGGRFALGLGSSTPNLAEGFHGVRFERPAERLGRTLQEVRSLLSGERAATTLASRGLRLGREPRPDIPLWAAAIGPRAVDAAIRHADAWFPAIVAKSQVDVVRAVGDPERRDRCELVMAAVGAVDVPGLDGIDAVRQLLGWYLTAMGSIYGDQLAASGHGDAVRALRAANPKPKPGMLDWPSAADVLLDELTVYGTPDHLAEQFDEWDRVADIAAVLIGPGCRDAVLATVEAAAPVS